MTAFCEPPIRMSIPQPSTSKSGGAEAGDAVDHEQRFRCELLERFGDRFDVVAYAGRGLGGLNVDGLVFRFERGTDFFQLEGFAIWALTTSTARAERLGEVDPALAEFSSREDQDPVAGRDQVGDEASMAPVPEEESSSTSLRVRRRLQLGQHL